MKKKTLVEIIDEIGNLYNSTNRSYCSGSKRCMYNLTPGIRCAFAHMVLPEYRRMLKEGLPASQIIKKLGLKIIKPEYRHDNIYFYNDIQRFHDNKKFWDVNGLSYAGVLKMRELKEHWSQDDEE